MTFKRITPTDLPDPSASSKGGVRFGAKVNDDFTGNANGSAPTTSDTGHTYTYQTNGAAGSTPTIASGKLTNTATSAGAAATYAEIDFAAPVTRIGAESRLAHIPRIPVWRLWSSGRRSWARPGQRSRTHRVISPSALRNGRLESGTGFRVAGWSILRSARLPHPWRQMAPCTEPRCSLMGPRRRCYCRMARPEASQTRELRQRPGTTRAGNLRWRSQYRLEGGVRPYVGRQRYGPPL